MDHRDIPVEYGGAPPKYVMLAENNARTQNLKPPPYRRTIPRYHSHQRKSSHGCLRCICCCYCFLIFLVILIFAIMAMTYHYYQPKVPIYKIQNMAVNTFDLESDLSLHADFVATVQAKNPNHKISITYGKGSSVVVYFKGFTLCSGKLPSLTQRPGTTKSMDVKLEGKSEVGSKLQEQLMDKNKMKKIPLLVVAKVPVKVVLGDFPAMGDLVLRQFNVNVNISLVVDQLSPGKKINILSSDYQVATAL